MTAIAGASTDAAVARIQSRRDIRKAARRATLTPKPSRTKRDVRDGTMLSRARAKIAITVMDAVSRMRAGMNSGAVETFLRQKITNVRDKAQRAVRTNASATAAIQRDSAAEMARTTTAAPSRTAMAPRSASLRCSSPICARLFTPRMTHL